MNGMPEVGDSTTRVAWLMLIASGVMEIVWALAMKVSHGFTRPWPTVVALVGMALSFGLLAAATRTIPMGTAYAVWVGIGAVGVAVVGMAWWEEPRNLLRIASIGLIVLGVLGLKWAHG